jgi:predicted TPR repeat methyltransferase
MDPIFLSSGDVIADRRFEWARDRQSKGDLTGAADLMMQAIELVPAYAPAWFVLGELRELRGDRSGAIAAFEQARIADPDDRHGAALRLQRLGGGSGRARTEGYLRALFDGYAPQFDHALTSGFRAPELLFRALETAHATARMNFGSVLDLGCGTGLAALPFRPFSDWMFGVDLSRGMLAQARAKGLYDRLVESEILDFLVRETETGASYHLVIAADLFMYFDDLAPLLAAVAQVSASGGHVAFTVETHEGDGITVRETLRYAHDKAHVEASLASAGLKLIGIDCASTRTEKGFPVPGLIVVAGR